MTLGSMIILCNCTCILLKPSACKFNLFWHYNESFYKMVDFVNSCSNILHIQLKIIILDRYVPINVVRHHFYAFWLESWGRFQNTYVVFFMHMFMSKTFEMVLVSRSIDFLWEHLCRTYDLNYEHLMAFVEKMDHFNRWKMI